MVQRTTGHAARWIVGLAFVSLYLSWGTTYYAIRVGVHDHHLPPALFGGVRVCLAGLILLIFLRIRIQALWLTPHEFITAILGGLLLFVGGNGLMTAGLGGMPSGIAAVLTATTPLWVSVMETIWPRGDKLTIRGWLGIAAGLVGVLLLYLPELQKSGELFPNFAPLLIMASNLSWALGSVVLRHRPSAQAHLTLAAYQMVIGGGGLALLGLTIGEVNQLSTEQLAPGAFASFFYLLIVGSLVGFVAFNYLLNHVSAPLVGTYAYVNPMIAILVGWALGGEAMYLWTLGGMVVILVGVALVRSGNRSHCTESEASETSSRDRLAVKTC
jgi:drug/metabolite transporter (DMT)-like permease